MRIRTWMYALIALAMATGCLTEGNFNEKLARDLCKKQQECDKAAFESQWSSVGDCVDDAGEEDPATECLKAAGCEFDKAEARNCREAVRSGTCEDFSDVEWANDCTDIYDCDTEQQAEFVECISDFDDE